MQTSAVHANRLGSECLYAASMHAGKRARRAPDRFEPDRVEGRLQEIMASSGCSLEEAREALQTCEGDVEQAVQLVSR